MNPIKFPEQTNTFSKGQPEFRILPVHQTEPDERGVCNYISKWEFTEAEKAQIALTGCFYSIQTGNCLHPQLPTVTSPFYQVIVEYKKNEAGLITATVPTTNGPEGFISTSFELLLHNILARFPANEPDHFLFVEKPLLAVDENGNIKDL